MVINNGIDAAADAGKQVAAKDVLALGGMAILGETPAASRKYYLVLEELWQLAYDAPPYHVPMGPVWTGSRQEVQDDALRLIDTFELDKIFIWQHVGYFADELAMASLQAFAEAVIEPLRQREA